jgi:uncharacterized protein YggU (UPF0235/DUF167 family)
MKLAKAVQFIEVRVKPRSSASALYQDETGAWFAQLRSAPTDGNANAELIALVAKHFDCPRSMVCIKRGAASRVKLVQIAST